MPRSVRHRPTTLAILVTDPAATHRRGRPAHEPSRARVCCCRERGVQRERRCRIEEAVLITGVYGSGKSSVAEEMAAVLEEHNAPYALLDLDFLAWFDTGGEGGPTEHRMMLRNLAAVVGNYLAVGVRFFVLAYAVRDGTVLDGIRATLPMPLKVVRLTVPLEKIGDRLSHNPTDGRGDDLREAAAWVAASYGVGLEDMTVPNDRPIREVDTDILDWLGWLERGSILPR
jgi:chloramphenicol 3-O-phosphotransferase